MPLPSATRIGIRLFCALALVQPACAAAPKVGPDPIPPRPLREFRGAWIATVANLDWPSKPGLPVPQQQAELVGLMDRAVELNLNVLIFQVRPACDALYASKLEPWSESLNGQMGRGPEPFYDPLAFAVTEAHRRGLELHAWFNPFRVRAPNFKGGMAPNHLSRTHPEYVRTYGSQLWLDPGLKEVRDHSTRVILDVVKRYDIDGVHLDDYFYPYPEKNGAGQYMDFPDNPSWRRYVNSGGRLERGDWRRKNIDDFVQALYQKIKAEKRWVKVGLSPFGIWRPGFPQQVQKGLDAYERLYADSRKWLSRGWADYFTPQLYWSIDTRDQSYPVLLDWWTRQNPKSRLICPGNDTTKVGTTWMSGEIIRQVQLTRKQAGAHGNVFWNLTSVARNQDQLADALHRDVFGAAALTPAVPWLAGFAPDKPKIDVRNEAKSCTITWNQTGTTKAWRWVYQSRAQGKWTTRLLPRGHTSFELPQRNSAAFPDAVAVTAVDRCGMASPIAMIAAKQLQPPTPKPAGKGSTNSVAAAASGG
jgi:uncharacterized lipoprotein YddW (UPF0748 family)